MTLLRRCYAPLVLICLIAVSMLGLAGCGGSSGSNSGSGSGFNQVNNNQPIEVNLGPANDYPNGVFTTVTICVPGTSTCQNIPDVLVDTGSEGLRLLSSQVTLSLPAVTDNGSNPLQECISFADTSYVWGPVESADIKMAGENASSVPIQLIDSSNPTRFPVPNSCVTGSGSNQNTVQLLGANGILGIGVFQQDCGTACASTTSNPNHYFLCPANGGACNAAVVPLQNQLQNPVSMFPQDNNGLLISLPSVPDNGAPTASGSLIFGIETQSDNGLGNAQVYTTDNSGNFHVIYNGIDYQNSFIDSGSNGLFFLDATTLASTGIQDCTTYSGFYCPSSTVKFTVTTSGLNGTSNPVSFNIADANALFALSNNNGKNAAFNDLGGSTGTGASTDYVDFGMPFFYGRDVFVGIENKTGPKGVVGPYWAY
ncbi:MAG: DUF3443 domain-containing protein [Acidobacteria bacterium]|nr:MAG: DUF3443 domain-containing protein [Acidobacteriota bacterium]